MRFASIIPFLLIATILYAAENVIMNPRANEDTVIKINDPAQPTGPVEDVLKADGGKASLIAPNGLATQDSSTSSPTVDSGETYWKPNMEIPSGETLTMNGEFNTIGTLTGDGTIAGSGSVKSLDIGQNGDQAAFEQDVVVGRYLNATAQPIVISSMTLFPSCSASEEDIYGTFSDSLNIGGGFSLGTYTAPVTGRYLYEVHSVLTNSFLSNQAVKIRIKVNGTTKRLAGDEANEEYFVNSTVLLNLVKGEQVTLTLQCEDTDPVMSSLDISVVKLF